ncbi:hypothetical protein PENTCL1PPCAC_18282, partial [Pristionchus entomophagus]
FRFRHTMVLHKNLKKLKRSISEKILGKTAKEEKQVKQGSRDESLDRDPYKEMLRLNSDNVSHLVLHGSSLRQLHSLHDISSSSISTSTSSTSSTSSTKSTVSFS